MRLRTIVLLLAGVGLSLQAVAQRSTLPLEGLRDERPRVHILYNARIVVAPGEVIERGSLVLDNGRVREVLRENAARPPGDAVDMHGKTLFAGFIEPQASISLSVTPSAPFAPGPVPAQQQLTDPGAGHFSRRVRPELSAAALLKLDPDAHKKLRAMGFAAAMTAPAQGIFRGQSALIQLLDGNQVKDALLKADVAQQLAFEMAFWPSDEYPGSLMGAIALVRQTIEDARWQRDMRGYLRKNPNAERIEANAALDALEGFVSGKQLGIFKADDELDFERIDKIGREFQLNLALLGNGFEYRRLNALVNAKRALIVPLNFPATPKLSNPDDALNTDLSALQHWEQAPANLARLRAAGLLVALTTAGVTDPDKNFWPNLRRAVKAGLSEKDALAALTTAPAQLLGAVELGTLKAGQVANVVVADETLFRANDAKIYQVWIDGQPYEINPLNAPDLGGTWQLTGLGEAREFKIATTPKLLAESGSEKISLDLSGQSLSFTVPGKWVNLDAAKVVATAQLSDDDSFAGGYVEPSGRVRVFSGKRTAAAAASAKKPEAASAPIPAFTSYPAGAYGLAQQPSQDDVLIQGATLWTLESEQSEIADILLRDGKIAAIGSGLKAGNARVIDGTGKHVTPGIVDAHSHVAISRNVNEPSSAITAEVRIGDVIDPTDINLYRQLAGGVTTAQLLHGSANPIGGQSAIIKFRWGQSAEAMKFEGAFPTIKFALGENVKQSNRGDLFTARYPQTRMGVEQILRDAFLAARAYDAAHKNAKDVPQRRVLRLETLAEIVNHQRFVNIHSYRQDEILMFARLAKEFDLTHVTFQHILEGYKVAEALKSINAGASGFADWWGFKMEVYDAIPNNGAILTRNGVLASFNSDSDEMARRLNTEAAKAMKYGDLSPVEALKLVTINAATHLGIDDRVGTLKVGKDADVVLWNGDPLSSFSRVETTFVDGRAYFDRAQDLIAQQRVRDERERLLQVILGQADAAPEADAKTDAGKPAPKRVSLWNFQTHEGWVADFAALRTIYHAGGNINACSAQEHHY
jgi:imidazolonepropionase-like amidohydrolase